MVGINDIPFEILEYILYLVSPYDDIKSCKQVCQKWYDCSLTATKRRHAIFYKALKSGKIQWNTITCTGSHSTTISLRYSHSACIYGSYMYVFGGCITSNTTFNDLWRYNLGTCNWTRLITTGVYPSPKAYASIITWKDSLLLFGGWTHPPVYPLHQQWVLFNEFHVYDIIANRWTQLYFDFSPPPTAGHSCTIHDNVLIIFGGLQKDRVCSSTNDIYIMNLLTHRWFKPETSKMKPLPRYGHSQIKLDESHLIVMSGCGGPNKLYSDVWLLKIPEDPFNSSEIWHWEPINIEGLENVHSPISYTPAVRISNHIVIFCKWQRQENVVSSKNKMSQILFPGNIRRNSNPQLNQNPDSNVQEAHSSHSNFSDFNINGQRGNFRSSPDQQRQFQQIARGPSIRPNASNNRDRMLEALSRMEKKLKAEKKVSGEVIRSDEVMVPHLLCIDKILTHKQAAWLPVSLNENGFPPFLGQPPSNCLLYSLLLGRGHLIMFGGLPNEAIDSHSESVSRIRVISAPSLRFLDS